jgi:hypothetical protein
MTTARWFLIDQAGPVSDNPVQLRGYNVGFPGKGVLMRWLLLAIGMLVFLLGCEPRHFRETEPVVSTPLPLDPTEEYELSRWWSNGTQILRLDRDAGYVIYSAENKYQEPVEQGRWYQQSYAVMWLEPYGGLKPHRERVSIEKIQGKIALVLPKLKPMFATDPPGQRKS